MKKYLSLAAAAICLTASASAQSPATPDRTAQQKEAYRLKLGEWAKFEQGDRVIIILGAIEGLLLAVQAPDSGKAPVNGQCLVKDSPLGIEQKLLQLKNRYANDAFVDVFLVTTDCLEAA